MTITKRVEFDAGHRLPYHDSKCYNLHGHHYILELTLAGPVEQKDGAAQSGMILDFSEIKQILKETIVDPWDHAFLVYEKDTAVREFLGSLPNHKTVVLKTVPTVENLAMTAFQLLEPEFRTRLKNSAKILKVRIFESANSWADFSPST